MTFIERLLEHLLAVMHSCENIWQVFDVVMWDIILDWLLVLVYCFEAID